MAAPFLPLFGTLVRYPAYSVSASVGLLLCGAIAGLADSEVRPHSVVCTTTSDDVQATFAAMFCKVQATKAQVMKVAVIGTDVSFQHSLRQYVEHSSKSELTTQCAFMFHMIPAISGSVIALHLASIDPHYKALFLPKKWIDMVGISCACSDAVR